MERCSITLARCDPAAEKVVLALAAQAWPDAERAAYWQAIGTLVRTGQAERVVLVSARQETRQENRLLAAQLGQALPGNVAVVWPPCFTTGSFESRNDLAPLLASQLFQGLAATGAQLAQALVATGDEGSAALLARGGFSRAAELLYLAAETHGPPATAAPASNAAPPFEIEVFQVGDEPRLLALIDRTYQGTLDCPSIDGLRKTADVIAGYQAVGAYRPELWRIVRHGGDDVGCLLINLHPDVGHAEIVYLALAPEVRGRSWGRNLAELAKVLAQRAGCTRLVLAVDAENHPAIRLYERAGFAVFDRRSVWIKSLA